MVGNDRESTCRSQAVFSRVKLLENYTAQHKLGVKVVYWIVHG